MPGITVYIDERRGIPVRPVTRGAPVLTVSTTGKGIPIRISNFGLPFIVEGLEPVTLRSVSMMDFGATTAYTGTASDVQSASPDGKGGYVLGLAGAGSPNLISKTADGFKFTNGRYLTVTGVSPSTADGFILLADMTVDTVSGTAQALSYGGLAVLRRASSVFQAFSTFQTPIPTVGPAAAGKRVLMAIQVDNVANTITYRNVDTGEITTAAVDVPDLAPTSINIGQGMAGTIHRAVIVDRPKGTAFPIKFEDAIAQAGGIVPPPAVMNIRFHDSDGQSLSLGPNDGATVAPDGRNWRTVFGGAKVQMMLGMTRKDGAAVTQVGAPLLAGYDLTSKATSSAPAYIGGNVPLGMIEVHALVDAGLISELPVFHFNGAGGQEVYNFDNNPQTGTPDMLIPYENLRHVLQQAVAFYAKNGATVRVPVSRWCQGEADVGLARGEYTARFVPIRQERNALVRQITGQAADPKLHIWQTGGYMRKTQPQFVVLDQLDIVQQMNAILIGPVYQFKIADANVHPGINATVAMGRLSAWAEEETTAGRAWNLLPGTATRDGDTITIPVTVRGDETLTTAPGKYADYGGDPANLGLEAVGGGSIASASVNGGNIVVNTTGTVTAIRYAFQPVGTDTRAMVDGTGEGYAAHRGLIRTTLTRSVTVGGLSIQLERWVPSFEVTVPEGANTISITSGPGFEGSTYTSNRAGQWTADGTPIAGATGTTYTMQAANEGKVIRCGRSNGIQMWTPALLDAGARAGTWWQPDLQADVTGGKATRLQNLFQTAAGALDAVQTDATKQPVVGIYNGRQHILNTTATNDAGLDATGAVAMKTMVFWGRYKNGTDGVPGGRYPAFLGSRANGPNRVHGGQNSNTLEVNTAFGNSLVWKNGEVRSPQSGRPDYFPATLPFNNSVVVVESSTGPSMMPTIGHGDPGGATQFDGEIGGVLYLPVALSVADRQNLEGYVRHRYAYSDLIAGHPRRDAPLRIETPAP